MAYKIWLNYNNDKYKYILPVTPEKITCSTAGINTSLSIDKLGEIFHKGKREAMTISWSSYFPARYSDQYCSCGKKNFHTPSDANKWIYWMMYVAEPIHLVVTGGPLNINMFVIIKSFKTYEQGGDVGTLYYTIELKEYRTVTIPWITKSRKYTMPPKKRVNNTVNQKIYTVQKYDTLRNIAKKYYGHKSQWKKIYEANKDLLNKTAKAHGHSSSHNGAYIYPGTKLVIP